MKLTIQYLKIAQYNRNVNDIINYELE